eukprot:7580587-Ditylum_brightwellii.AAC.1
MGTDSANRHKRETQQLHKSQNALEDGVSTMDSNRQGRERTAQVFWVGNSNGYTSTMGGQGTSTKQPRPDRITSSGKYSFASSRPISVSNHTIWKYKSIN